MYSGHLEGAAYYHNLPNDKANVIDTTALPPHLFPQYDVPPDPWFRTSAIQNDFLVIAEFSELEGPKPLIIIPHNNQWDKDFDINQFVVKIMSVDHHCPANGQFSLPEDTQVVLNETSLGVYSYVHHFTLHDSQARGFVRPFCMAYVTPDQRKVTKFFEEMQKEFGQVSWLFKYGNLKLFQKDMMSYRADLKYTLDALKNTAENPEGVSYEDMKILESNTAPGLRSVIAEVESILERLNPFMNDETLDKKFRSIEEKQNRREKIKRMTDHVSFDDATSADSNPPSLMSDERMVSSMSKIDQATFPTLSEDVQKYQPKLIHFQRRRRFDSALRSIHELSVWGAKEGLNRLRSIYKFFSRELSTLEIERRDSQYMEPPSCLLTIGRCVTINFLHSIDLLCTSSEWPACPKKRTPFSRSTSNIGLTRRWLSTDSIESFKSAESFLSCSEDANEAPMFMMGPACLTCKVSQDDYAKSTNSADTLASPQSDDSDIYQEALEQPNSMHFIDDDFTGDHDPPSPKKSKLFVVSAVDHVQSLEPKSIGYGILNIIQTYTYCYHLLASLLSGRPVLVVGHDEEYVKAVLNAFKLFLPGHSSSQQISLIPKCRPIKILDLIKLKLIGMIKNEKTTIGYIIPHSMKGFVSVIDLDKKWIQCPEYTGAVIKTIVNKRKSFNSEQSFIAFIHSVLLELAGKAYLYYHTYVLNAAGASNADSICSSSQNYTNYRILGDEAAEYVQKLGVHPGDVSIVQYLTELIKCQQSEEYYNQELGLHDRQPTSSRLVYAQPAIYRS